MANIIDELTYLQATKDQMQTALSNAGSSVDGDTPFRDYATEISGLDVVGYTRPASWLALPTVLSSEQKFVGLYAIYNHDSNYVVLSAESNFTVDWGDGSAPENISSGGDATHLYDYDNVNLHTDTVAVFGYKQAVITITANGGNLTDIYLYWWAAPEATATYAPFLDIKVAGSNLTNLEVDNLYMLEQFEFVGTHSITDMTNFFAFDTRLQNIVAFDTSNVTNFNYMFESCFALTTIPLLDTSSGANFSFMFNACYSLQSIPLLDTSSGTNFSYMFYYNYSLTEIPSLVTSLGTNFNAMFNDCYSLQTIPLLDTSLATNVTYMFKDCYALQVAPAFNVTSSTGPVGMFRNCYSLSTVGALNTTGCTSLSLAFQYCYMLQTIGALDVSSVTNFGSTFATCESLSKSEITGAITTHSYSNCRLSATQLDSIYTNLGDGSGQTITVSGNPGTGTDDPSIATAKNWTVTG